MAAIARTRGRARIKGDTWRRVRKSWPWYLFILPNVLGFLAFGLFPLISVLVLSFYHWYLFTSPNFLGLRNFVNLAGDDESLTTLPNTAAYAGMAVLSGRAASPWRALSRV